jgi:hypothetical protein
MPNAFYYTLLVRPDLRIITSKQLFANSGYLAVTFLSAVQPTVAFWISVKTHGF